MHYHKKHILIESPAHLVIGPPPNDPDEFWPFCLPLQNIEELDISSEYSSQYGDTSSNGDYSTGGEEPPSPSIITTTSVKELLASRRRRRRHHHRHQYHSFRHPWMWGIIKRPSLAFKSMNDDPSLASSSSSTNKENATSIKTTAATTTPASDDWIERISHLTLIAKPRALGIWPPSRPKPHGCLPTNLYYSMLLTAYGTRQRSGRDGAGERGQTSDVQEQHEVLRQWIIPFIHRLGDGHDDAGGLTTRLCGDTEEDLTDGGNDNGPPKLDLDLNSHHDIEDYEERDCDEDDGGAFITRKWKALNQSATSSQSDDDAAAATTTTAPTKKGDHTSLYIRINALQAEDSASTQIHAHFLEPIPETKHAVLPGFEEYWIETLHEYGLCVRPHAIQAQKGAQKGHDDQASILPQDSSQQEESLDWSRSPFCYCSTDLLALLPCE
ncbi:hypothetical protein BGW42_004873 [Actinomortierella wolfii]|nr:hypothetical protein BGW42_004873 [Actinomortierella wolfii]